MIATLLIVLLIGSTLVMSTAAIVIWLLPTRSAANRFSIWQIAITSLLLLPIGALCLPEIPLGFDCVAQNATSSPPEPLGDWKDRSSNSSPTIVPVESAFPQRNVTSPVQIESEDASLAQVAASPIQPTGASQGLRFPVSQTAAVVWLSVAAVLLLRTLLAHFRVALAASFADNELDLPIVNNTNWLPDCVDLVCSDWQKVPVTIGILRRQIFLPASAVDWPADQVRMVLKHELAHVLRHDVLWQLVTSIATSLFWFQPLAWWADHQLRLERERACDDQVIAGGEQAANYATVLVQLAATFSGRSAIPTGALSMAQKPLERRLVTILSPSTSRTSTSRWLGSLATVGAVLVVAGVCSIRPFASLAIAAATGEPTVPIFQDSPVKSKQPRDVEQIKQVAQVYHVADLLLPSPFVSTENPINTTGKSPADPQPLIELIQNTIHPSSWQAAGEDGLGTMRFFEPNLSLIVSQEPEVHNELQDLLKKLHELNDITIDLRGFLIVGPDGDIKQSPIRTIPKTATKVNRYEVAVLHNLATVNDSVSSSEFKHVNAFNGQDANLVFPDLDITLANSISVRPISSPDRKSVQASVMFNNDKLGKPEYTHIQVKTENGRIETRRVRVGQKAAALTGNTKNGQCVAIDVSSILPDNKKDYRAILVFRPYVMDLN